MLKNTKNKTKILLALLTVALMALVAFFAIFNGSSDNSSNNSSLVSIKNRNLIEPQLNYLLKKENISWKITKEYFSFSKRSQIKQDNLIISSYVDKNKKGTVLAGRISNAKMIIYLNQGTITQRECSGEINLCLKERWNIQKKKPVTNNSLNKNFIQEKRKFPAGVRGSGVAPGFIPGSK